MIYLIKQIWPCLLIAGLIGLIFGWLLKRVCKKRSYYSSDYDSSLNLDVDNKEIVELRSKLNLAELSAGDSMSKLDEVQSTYKDIDEEIVILRTKLEDTDSSQQELELMKAKVSRLEFSLKESERKSLLLDDKEADIELKHKKVQELDLKLKKYSLESNNKDQEIKLLKGRLNNADLNLLSVKKDAQAQTFIGTSSINIEEVEHLHNKLKNNDISLNNKNLEIKLLKGRLVEADQRALDSTIKAIKPKFLKQADNGISDNLQLIKGVGAKLNEVLNELGVFHFYQIASWEEKEVAWVNDYLAFSGRIQRDEWIKQAKLLMEGKETDFSKRVEQGEVPTSDHKNMKHSKKLKKK